MRLTSYTDFALRTLMHLAVNRERLVTIQEVADVHGIAKNHLTKVVHQLGQLGIVETVRGRNGGLRLAREADDIFIGEVVRSTEPDFYMAECFDRSKNHCIFTSSCVLKSTLREATAAYLKVLDAVSLESLVAKPGQHASSEAAVKAITLHRRRPAAEA
jgi:Rrf2 family nitric oxide-sensitive transcriptional repressor